MKFYKTVKGYTCPICHKIQSYTTVPNLECLYCGNINIDDGKILILSDIKINDAMIKESTVDNIELTMKSAILDLDRKIARKIGIVSGKKIHYCVRLTCSDDTIFLAVLED